MVIYLEKFLGFCLDFWGWNKKTVPWKSSRSKNM